VRWTGWPAKSAGARLAVATVLATGAAVWWSVAPFAPPASAGTLANTLQFEGGSFAEPIMNQLIQDDQPNLGSIYASYFETDLDTGRSDFVSGDTDVAVSELPLTSSEASTITAKGGGFAYVPFAASAVAMGYALICYQGGSNPYALCPNLQLTALQIEQLFTGTVDEWSDPSLSTISGGSAAIHPTNDSRVFSGTLIAPSASTLALETYLDTDPASQAAWTKWSTTDELQASGEPTERWPADDGFDGGDLILVQSLIPINPNGDQPTPNPNSWGISCNIAALPVDWLGPPENIPTFAIQNAAGQFVQPTIQAETAALDDATMNSSNIVTFQPEGGTDQAAYPMMQMSYLVVPTKGLSAAKATALSQFINFLATPAAAADIEKLGGVPPTAAMLQADSTVASEVAAEANTGGATTSTTTTTVPGRSSTPSSGLPASGAQSPPPAASVTSSQLGLSGSGAASAVVTLANTGLNVLPIVGLGLPMAVVGFYGRRRLRRSLSSP